MNINTMTFVALKLPRSSCVETVLDQTAGNSAPRSLQERAPLQLERGNFSATLRAAGLFRADFVARSLQIHVG